MRFVCHETRPKRHEFRPYVKARTKTHTRTNDAELLLNVTGVILPHLSSRTSCAHLEKGLLFAFATGRVFMFVL